MIDEKFEYSDEFIDRQQSNIVRGKATIAAFFSSLMCHVVLIPPFAFFLNDFEVLPLDFWFFWFQLPLAFVVLIDTPLALWFGWLSHRLFHKTGLSVTMAAVAMAMICWFYLFGWVFVLAQFGP